MKTSTKALKAALDQAEPNIDSARYVAHLLKIDPTEPFAQSPDSSPEGNQHLVDFILTKLSSLLDTLHEVNDGTIHYAMYAYTLERCVGVACGKIKPPRGHWDERNDGCCRGIYRGGRK